jgi:thiol-disulfide isomerase/thioredoxin
MTEPTPSTQNPAKRRTGLIAAGILAGLVIGLGGVYGIGGLSRNAGGDNACRPAVTLAGQLATLARGQVAAVNVAKAPLKVPNLAFVGADGKPLSLADWQGKTVLLNLWATWCVPCREEMPTLDALEGQLGGPNFQVVAVNIDTRDPEKPKTFLRDIGVKHLSYYADASAKSFQELKSVGRAFGMPTTLLIDPHGCELGTIAGPADWASGDAVKLIKAALGQS